MTLKISVLGASGSIGRAALSLALSFSDLLEVTALAAHSNLAILNEQIRLFKPALVSVSTDELRRELASLLADLPRSLQPELVFGESGLISAAIDSGAQMVVSAVVGAAGLKPTWAAVNSHLKVALANKESLVLAGDLIMGKALGTLSPIDSEHSAIFQALGGRLRVPELKKIILTASGGPFRGFSRKDLESVTRQMALKHPTWSMGPKITVDSATMMNKGLEIIEAHHLFGLSYDQIEVLVHPLSLIHSMAQFHDGSILAQLGPADMRLAIAYALSYPERWPIVERAERLRAKSYKEELDHKKKPEGAVKDLSDYQALSSIPDLSFEPPDLHAFPAMALAQAAGRAGGLAPSILNGANEEAAAAFLDQKLSFIGISEVVGECLERLHSDERLESIDQALEADQRAKALAKQLIAKRF
ncbi:MAG: 1-deoxy-D-xylulose-5-phosphate reductoisomerase [Deltaproteobacteria bacterium]|jgi:1-deoxy-D-xylulose-5-phosphate reductoisomerase|nr:1-deoxy-D-xylulose-5-phosphate reductoisomerase [Deltaproteobacteria bacterium]